MADNAARERRLQRLKDERRQELPKLIAKRAAIGAVVLVAVVGLGAAIYFSSGPGSDDCPGHWHASFGVYVDGERVQIPQPPYNFEQDRVQGGVMPLSLHLHSGDTEQFHFEPQGRRTCVGVEDAMEDVGITLDSDRIQFADPYDGGPVSGSHRENETHKLRLFLQMPGDEEPRERSFSAVDDYQLKDGEKLMVAFGDHSDEELQTMMDAIDWPSAARPPSHDG